MDIGVEDEGAGDQQHQDADEVVFKLAIDHNDHHSDHRKDD